MRFSLKSLIAAAALSAGTLLAGTANAALITQNQNFLFANVVATATVNPGDTGNDTNQQTLSFGAINKFNTALGTLNSVTFNISWNGEVEYFHTTFLGNTGYTSIHQSQVAFRADGTTNSVAANASATVNMPPTLLGGLSGVGAQDISGGNIFTETNAALLALFSGSGAIASTIQLENFVDLTVSSGGGPASASSANCPAFGSQVCGFLAPVSGSLSLTYDYTAASAAVSAPGGIALLALGLIGFGMSRRRA
jgi:hypothetical protein